MRCGWNPRPATLPAITAFASARAARGVMRLQVRPIRRAPRRGPLRRRRAGALFTATAIVAAAFVAYSGAAEGAPAARGARVDQNGVLKYGIDLTGSSINTFDPTGDASPATTLMTSLVYDTLLHALPDGSYEPGLAQQVTIVDPQTIDVGLHPNMKFTDGTPVDSAAAQFNHCRMRDAETG